MNEDRWEAAYLAFETPAKERRKFLWRLRRLGVARVRAGTRAVELFCGRGAGIAALRDAGFASVFGIDLSLRLCADAPRGFVADGDCRSLPIRSQSIELAVIQGGLHHLQSLKTDLAYVLREVARVLTSDGFVVIVEPWQTPFLRFVHAVSRFPPLRWASKKVDAFATMVELEGDVYRTWLENPEVIEAELRRFFDVRHDERRFGKIYFVGVRR